MAASNAISSHRGAEIRSANKVKSRKRSRSHCLFSLKILRDNGIIPPIRKCNHSQKSNNDNNSEIFRPLTTFFLDLISKKKNRQIARVVLNGDVFIVIGQQRTILEIKTTDLYGGFGKET